jgi:hypothetical protein
MDRLKRGAILTRLIEDLRDKHGPFSFDLRDELTGLRADELVTLEPQWPYGPRIAATERSAYILRLYRKTLDEYGNRISFVADKLGRKDVAELERLATAFYITEELGPYASVEERAGRLTEVKPHIPRNLAAAAVTSVDSVIAEAPT